MLALLLLLLLLLLMLVAAAAGANLVWCGSLNLQGLQMRTVP